MTRKGELLLEAFAIIPGFEFILLHYGISCAKLSGRNTT